jgi:uncharacterized protein with ParB-like and HNH nuclease domain
VKAGETTLLGILKTMNHFIVPLFQRPYTWNERNWKTLWDDVMATYRANGQGDHITAAHFLGSIVTKSLPSTPEGVSPFLLVDGQQRLTTITILLAAIRDQIRPDFPDTAEMIQNLYLVNRYAPNHQAYRVLPSQPDRQPYFNLINGKVNSAPHSQILHAYTFFLSQLSHPDEDNQPLDLKRLTQVVTAGLEIVSITLGSAENEYRIFESLNGKGEPLTQADLLRNFIFMSLPAKQQEDVYAEYWKPMQDTLGNALNDFIRYVLMSQGQFVREKDVYQEWKKQIGSKDAPPLLKQLKDLARDSRFYNRLIEPNNESDNTISESLVRLNRWGAQTVYPFLLNLFRQRDDGKVNTGEFIAILQMIESFLVRRLLAGVSTKALNRLFVGLWQQAQATSDRADIVACIRSVLSEPGRRWPTDQEVRDGIVRLPFYMNGRAEQRRLVLEMIERSYGHLEKVDLSNLTIEHIMPQTLSSGWSTELGAGAREVHRRYLHVLGNVTLTAYNGNLSNSPFQRKRQLLSKSNLELNKQIAEDKTWGPDEIQARGARLANQAIEIWPGPVPQAPIMTVYVPPPESDGSVATVRRILTRIPLHDNQRLLFKLLYEAGESGLTSTEIAARAGWTPHVYVGVLGALGRRANNTIGAEGATADKPGIGLLFEISYGGGIWHYRMLPNLRAALEAENLV